jgi:hypothetical protein
MRRRALSSGNYALRYFTRPARNDASRQIWDVFDQNAIVDSDQSFTGVSPPGYNFYPLLSNGRIDAHAKSREANVCALKVPANQIDGHSRKTICDGPKFFIQSCFPWIFPIHAKQRRNM